MQPEFFARTKFHHPHSLVLFEMESNYACFHGDACVAAGVLALDLLHVQKAGENIPTILIRREFRDSSIRRLILAGHRVTVCRLGANNKPRSRATDN